MVGVDSAAVFFCLALKLKLEEDGKEIVKCGEAGVNDCGRMAEGIAETICGEGAAVYNA